MQFRKSSVSDIDRIMDILADGRRALSALGIDQWQGGYPHRDVIERDVERGDSYVAVDDNGSIAATIMVGFAGEKDYDVIHDGAWLTDCLSNNPCYGVIHRVAVSADFTGRGAASFLVESAESLARERGSQSVRVDTHPGNVPMRKLLDKLGYTQCGIIHIAHAEEGTPERIAYEKHV